MQYFLLNMEIEGSKSLDKKITIDFYKKNIDLNNPKQFDDYKIKAIYGENGTGKTAIIDAMKIIRGCINNERFILDKKDLLEDIINQKLNYISVKVVGVIYFEKPIIFEYHIKIEKDIKHDKYFIVHESLFSKSKSLSSNGRNLFSVESNILNTSSKLLKDFDKVKLESFRNVSLINQFNNYYNLDSNSLRKLIEENMEFKYIIAVNLFFRAIKIYEIDSLEREENYEYYKIENLNDINGLLKLASLKKINKDNCIHRDNLDFLQATTKKLESFIKLFKPTLKEIKLKQVVNNDLIYFERLFVYKNGTIVSELFESTGIKKLAYYFNAIQDIINGNIVFVDELDANVHENVLSKLIEYIRLEETGQLIFTAHNLNVLDLISDMKKSIDFLSKDSQLVSWIKNGNYSASNTYLNGFVPGVPFSLSVFDFYPVFVNE